jgi:hypothetical protein
MWASAESFPSAKKFDKSSLVDDLRPTVDVPLTDSLRGSPDAVGTTMLPSRKMLERRKSMSLPVQPEPKRLLGQNEIYKEE